VLFVREDRLLERPAPRALDDHPEPVTEPENRRASVFIIVRLRT